MNYQEQLEAERKARQAYQTAMSEISAELLSACVPANKRPGAKPEAYNLPDHLNAKVYAIYEKFAKKYRTGGRVGWGHSVAMMGRIESLQGFSLHDYANGDKFYLSSPFTKEQTREILNALDQAAAEIAEEERY